MGQLEPTGAPWAFQRWAFEQKTGSVARKAVLSMLATMADSTTGRCEAKQATIAEGVELSDRAVRTHLRALEQAGTIARRAQRRIDGSRRGDEFLLLAPWVTEWPDGEAIATRNDLPPAPGSRDPGGPEAGIRARTSSSGTSTPDGSGQDARDEFPDDLPAELLDVAIAAGKILKRTALERRQKREVTRAAVGHAVLSYPDRDHVKVAREVEAWLLHGKGSRRPCSDIVARFRRFLDTADPMPGPPIAPGQVRPNGSSSSGPGRLHAMADELERRGL